MTQTSSSSAADNSVRNVKRRLDCNAIKSDAASSGLLNCFCSVSTTLSRGAGEQLVFFLICSLVMKKIIYQHTKK